MIPHIMPVSPIPMGMGLTGMMWGIILSTWLSAGLLYGRFLMLGRRVPAA